MNAAVVLVVMPKGEATSDDGIRLGVQSFLTKPRHDIVLHESADSMMDNSCNEFRHVPTFDRRYLL